MTASANSLIARIPPGSAVLFFIQMVSTLGFAVLYSSLVLYATQKLALPTAHATAIMGVFGAFNYGLHLFGGYLGGRLMSNRNLFVAGMVLQVLGCASIAGGYEALLLGLALFLTGSGLNVTCLNMMLTQRFAPEDHRREGAFLWNYAGMNIGFVVGNSVAGIFEDGLRYSEMFWFAALGNVLAILLSLAYWKVLADRDTPLMKVDRAQFKLRFAAGMAILIGLVPTLWYLLHHPGETSLGMKVFCTAVALLLLVLTTRHPVESERRRMWAYPVLTLGSLVFWSLYQMAPSGLQLFAVGNVRLELFGLRISPQWLQNVNPVVIVIAGPLLAVWFAGLRERGWPVDIPQQFACALLLMGLGFLVLPLGIQLAGADGRVAINWLVLSYALQSLGELLISPIGYAMIGRLAPRQHQGLMMGSWMLVTGLASLFAADFSGVVAQPADGSPLTSNPAYALLFTQLGLGSVVVAGLLFGLRGWLRRLIDGPALSR